MFLSTRTLFAECSSAHHFYFSFLSSVLQQQSLFFDNQSNLLQCTFLILKKTTTTYSCCVILDNCAISNFSPCPPRPTYPFADVINIHTTMMGYPLLFLITRINSQQNFLSFIHCFVLFKKFPAVEPMWKPPPPLLNIFYQCL